MSGPAYHYNAINPGSFTYPGIWTLAKQQHLRSSKTSSTTLKHGLATSTALAQRQNQQPIARYAPRYGHANTPSHGIALCPGLGCFHFQKEGEGTSVYLTWKGKGPPGTLTSGAPILEKTEGLCHISSSFFELLENEARSPCCINVVHRFI